MVPGEDILAIIDSYDRASDQLEAQQIALVNSILDKSFKKLERELRQSYGKLQSIGGLVAAQRKTLVMEQLGALLELINPDQATEIEQALQQAIASGVESGADMAGQMVEQYGGVELDAFAMIPMDAIANQAREGVRRLRRHSAEFQDRANVIVGQGLVQGWGANRVARLLRSELGTTKGKAETIARTEMMSALNQGAIARYEQANVKHVRWNISPSESLCIYCADRNQNVYLADKVVYPLHPRDRCFLSPWKPEWQEKGLVDEKFAVEYRQRGIDELAKRGLKPSSGPAPFEKAAGLDKPPRPAWSPGKQATASRPQPRQPSQAAKFVRSDDIRSTRKRLEKLLGPELLAKADANFKRLVDKNGTAIRVRTEVIDRIVLGGRFKSSIELEAERQAAIKAQRANAPEDLDEFNPFADDDDFDDDDGGTKGADYNRKRREMEGLFLANANGLAARDRPIYGYIQDADSSYDGPLQYGRIIMEVKPEVRQRSTVLGDDSFLGGFASEASNADAASLLNSNDLFILGAFERGDLTPDEEDRVVRNLNKLMNGVAEANTVSEALDSFSSQYFEVQMHGQVTMSDISRMIFTDGSSPSSEVRQWAEENGVEIEIR